MIQEVDRYPLVSMSYSSLRPCRTVVYWYRSRGNVDW